MFDGSGLAVSVREGGSSVGDIDCPDEYIDLKTISRDQVGLPSSPSPTVLVGGWELDDMRGQGRGRGPGRVEGFLSEGRV